MPGSMIVYFFILIVGMLLGGFVNFMIHFFLEINCLDNTYPKEHVYKFSWHDMLPAVFFLLLKGRCRSNGAKVSRRNPLVELANGVLYVIVFMANGWNLLSICYCLMTSAFLVISIVDWLSYEIPLPCNIFLGGLGIIVCVLDFANLFEHLIGLVSISFVLYILFVFSKGAAIGGGDVKLMAVAGLIIGWKLIILAFLLGCIIGSVCHVIRMKVSKADRVLAMGPYLCLGVWICTFWGNRFITWYFASLIR